MLELGKFSSKLHAELVEPLLRHGISEVFMVGPEMAHLYRALPKEINGYHFEDAKQLESALVKMPLSGDVIMVKSSNGIGLSRIVKKMRDKYKAVDRSD